MTVSTRAACTMAFLALLCASDNLATAKPGVRKGVFSPRSFTPKPVSGCSKKIESNIRSGNVYYIVTLHIPDVAFLLTSAPCSSLANSRCAQDDDIKPASYPSGMTPTLFDVNLSNNFWTSLIPTSFTDRSHILLRIRLDGKQLSFDTGGLNATNALQQDVNDQMFYCRAAPTSDGTSAYVDVLVQQVPEDTVGSLNVGIDVDEGTNAVLPIILDPHVPNNG